MHMHPLRLSLFALLLLAALGLSQEAEASISGIQFNQSSVDRTDSVTITVEGDDFDGSENIEIEYYSPSKSVDFYLNEKIEGTSYYEFETEISDNGKYVVAQWYNSNGRKLGAFDSENNYSKLWEKITEQCVGKLTHNSSYVLALSLIRYVSI